MVIQLAMVIQVAFDHGHVIVGIYVVNTVFPQSIVVTENMLAAYVYRTTNIPDQSVEWTWQAAGHSFHVSTIISSYHLASCVLFCRPTRLVGYFDWAGSPAVEVIAFTPASYDIHVGQAALDMVACRRKVPLVLSI
uniref:ORF13 n=1 Tax=Malaco herpesvirus 4 TaxID=3031800 RepID=A0AA48P814_9VIRU|nr:TPA_asm: ORF13 [Malaco herpesvirus 4]